jgi:DNA-binding NtrC family response regulator
LYWRLNVVPIVIPPLRMRRDDIPALVAHFLNYYSEKNDKNVVHIQAEAIAALQDYHWPGNVRELQNYVERAVAMADGDELTVEQLPDAVLGRAPRRGGRGRSGDIDSLVFDVVQTGLEAAPADETNLHEKIVNRVERELIVQVMESCNSVQTKAATRLGINRNTLRSKLQQYNLEEQAEE